MEENFQVRDIFKDKVVDQLAQRLRRVWREFDTHGFYRSIHPKLKTLTFSERNNLIRDTLREYLPRDYPCALKIILDALPPELPDCDLSGFGNFIVMPQNEYVAKYGLEHYDLSIQALYQMTKRFTAEGAIRPFIQRYPERTLAMLSEWAEDENCHVRRLVSEGTRPRLPWTMQLKPFIEDPRPILPLLEKLKCDPELMVRRSVANNINDIARDHPDLVVKTLSRWKKIKDEGTQWLVRHAARTLVKQGNKDILTILGYSSQINISVSKIKLDKARLKTGETLEFAFEVKSTSRQIQTLVIDYIVHHVKANGKRTPKVFKLTDKTLEPSQAIKIAKIHSFRPITTRRYYPGRHALEIQVNGTSYQKIDFDLRVQ